MSHTDRSRFIRQRLAALRMGAASAAVAFLSPSITLRAKAGRPVKAPVSDSVTDTLANDLDHADTARRALALTAERLPAMDDSTIDAEHAGAVSALESDTAPQGNRELDGLLTNAERISLALDCPRAAVAPADRPAPIVPRDVLSPRFVPAEAVGFVGLIDPEMDREARAQGWADFAAEYPTGAEIGRDASLCGMMGTEG